MRVPNWRRCLAPLWLVVAPVDAAIVLLNEKLGTPIPAWLPGDWVWFWATGRLDQTRKRAVSLCGPLIECRVRIPLCLTFATWVDLGEERSGEANWWIARRTSGGRNLFLDWRDIEVFPTRLQKWRRRVFGPDHPPGNRPLDVCLRLPAGVYLIGVGRRQLPGGWIRFWLEVLPTHYGVEVCEIYPPVAEHVAGRLRNALKIQDLLTDVASFSYRNTCAGPAAWP